MYSAVAKGWQKSANVVALDMGVKVLRVRLLKSVGYVVLRCLLFCLRLLSGVVCELQSQFLFLEHVLLSLLIFSSITGR
jgi:hypothetical protein